jgi:hypothetical protein
LRKFIENSQKNHEKNVITLETIELGIDVVSLVKEKIRKKKIFRNFADFSSCVQ